MQVEITDETSCIDASGKSINLGWARRPLWQFSPEDMHGPKRRIFASDRYIIFSSSCMMCFQVMDDGLLGYIGATVMSLIDDKRSTKYIEIPFPMGEMFLPSSSSESSLKYQRGDANFIFSPMPGGAKIIKIDFLKFGHKRHLRGEVVLSPLQNADEIVINQQWKNEKWAFTLAERNPSYIAEGVMQHGAEEYIFTKGNSFGIFDWSRGIRPKSDIHYWAAACGKTANNEKSATTIAWNFGYSGADSSLATENAYFINGKIHKIDDIYFKYSRSNLMLPWTITNRDNSIEINFKPHQERMEKHRMFYHYHNRRQFCGSFSGKIDEYSFKNISGFAEFSRTKH
ncbi:MAG: DUF2804 domain-containing protein [Spirochaetaceae bacterium]|jgi:hypothetical protein|nr:DUF2804 domain-containing protein [Spirochaetaceae bacterium]